MESKTNAVGILVVDDHRTFTDLVRMALSAEPDLECVGVAHDLARARVLVQETDPDVVLLDVNLGSEDGLDLAAELLPARPDLVVVVLTAHGDTSVMRRAAASGVSALLPKDGSLPDLLSSLRNAHRGGLMVHPELLQAMVAEPPAPQPTPVVLTPREREVLELLADGQTVTTIARQLGITVHTCRGYVKTMMGKLGVHSQLEAVVVSVLRGIVDAPRPH